MNVNLTIDRIVLDGFSLDPGARAELHAALEQEISRLLAQSGLGTRLQMSGDFAAVPPQRVEITAGHDPATLGREIAGAIYRGIGS